MTINAPQLAARLRKMSVTELGNFEDDLCLHAYNAEVSRLVDAEWDRRYNKTPTRAFARTHSVVI